MEEPRRTGVHSSVSRGRRQAWEGVSFLSVVPRRWRKNIAVASLTFWLTLFSAASVVYRLEERVRAAPECRGADARRAGGDPVWSHVREAGHRHHRRQFAASERARGAGARHASGSAGEETAAGGDRELRPGQRVS